MKTIMATRRSSTQQLHDLFRHVSLTASYCSDLKLGLEAAFGEYSNGRHQDKDASEDVYRLAYELFKTKSVSQFSRGRESAFKPADILHLGGGDVLFNSIERFNDSQFGDHDLDDTIATPIAELDDILGEDSE